MGLARLPLIADIAARGARRVLDPLERLLIDACQRDFPLCPRPFAEIGRRLDCTEAEVLAAFERLREAGVISRLGAVVPPNRAGRSTLAAMTVPPDRLAAVAARINRFPEVNHNYEREHRLNLWFVVAAATEERVRAVLDAIAEDTGLAVVDLPLSESYHLDLGFPIQWH